MHTRRPWVAATVLAALASFSLPGCGRGDQQAPATETQSQSQRRAPNQPMTVVGCLRAGEAGDTFVLTTGGTDVATYNLVGADGVNLRDHVGHQVEVRGVLTEQQQATSRTDTAPDEQPAGTAGTPNVQTRTTVDLRQMEVSAVTRTAETCR